jgi:hypothetical protein
MKEKQVILSAVAMIIAGFMSTVWGALAVDFGGDYRTSNQNATQTLTLETGDYDFAGGSNDRRGYRGIDSSFISLGSTLPGVENKNKIFNAGVQIANFNSDVDPSLILYRLNSTTPSDTLQASNEAGTTSMGLAFAPYVTKANFLNGQNTIDHLRFEDAENSISFSLVQLASGQTARFLVKSGSSWYVSASERKAAAEGALSLNGYTETWYAYDPSNSLFLNTNNLGTGVSGSTLTDIQAFGVFMQGLNFDGTTSHAANFQVLSFQASVIPEPATIGLFMMSSGY